MIINHSFRNILISVSVIKVAACKSVRFVIAQTSNLKTKNLVMTSKVWSFYTLLGTAPVYSAVRAAIIFMMYKYFPNVANNLKKVIMLPLWRTTGYGEGLSDALSDAIRGCRKGVSVRKSRWTRVGTMLRNLSKTSSVWRKVSSSERQPGGTKKVIWWQMR